MLGRVSGGNGQRGVEEAAKFPEMREEHCFVRWTDEKVRGKWLNFKHEQRSGQIVAQFLDTSENTAGKSGKSAETRQDDLLSGVWETLEDEGPLAH